VHLVFGARQTGKTTLAHAVLPSGALCVDLSDPVERSRLLADPGELIKLCRALPAGREAAVVLVDEAQAAPAVFDAVQHRDGAEIDFIVERGGELIPIEVKWTERPVATDARHLLSFLAEHPRRARRAFIVCRCPRPLSVHDRVIAIPWSCL
jgi:predicted AAA+ superfamily ATPase